MEQHTQELLENGVNPWQEKLEKQGLDFSIKEKFLKTPDLNFKTDHKTNLIIETNDVRIHLVKNLSDCIKNGKKWALVYSDVDNLKTANTRYKRPFGDMVIKYGAAEITQFVDSVGISPNVDVLTTTDTRAADECSVWLFGLSDKEIAKLRYSSKLQNNDVRISEPEYSFSTSKTIIAYDDPRIQEELKKTQEFLASDKNNLAYDFYQHSIKEIAENDVARTKIEKDLDRLRNLPQDRLLTDVSMKSFISKIVETFGNSRISDKLLDVLLKLTSAQTAISISKSSESKKVFIDLLKEIGVSEKQINTAKTPNDLLEIFKDLFGF